MPFRLPVNPAAKILAVKCFLSQEPYRTPLVLTHNEGFIIFQYHGWSINIYDDGTWFWEDTSGG